MDYLAHALWTRAIYARSPHPWWGAFWGVFPDTICWVPFLIVRLFSTNSLRPDVGGALPEWVSFMYGLSHSVVVFAVVVGALYIIRRRVPIYIWGWLIHIAIDVPTHAADRWPTPFLWPVADFHFPGVSWGSSWFMIANYIALIGIYAYLYYQKRSDAARVAERTTVS
jgi:hypothetical protein